tara:strand:+ start:275 stop:1471 length:1197 start_codon:yes stop_codon:yes gene_type:complete
MIEAARERIRDYVYETAAPTSSALTKRTGCAAVYLKLENRQKTRAFKARGALNRILTLDDESLSRGIIAASAGNHAQGVALGAQIKGVTATIVMPEGTPITKVGATRSYGAEIVLAGASYNDAYEHALVLAKETGKTFVHAFDDPYVIAGQGTIGLEILEQRPETEVVLVPIGGGGLIAGIGCAIKEIAPHVRVIGVQTMALPSMRDSVEAGAITTLRPAVTIADGIAVTRPGDLTFPLVQRYVDEVVAVSDDEIAAAILFLLEREKLLSEGAGAAGVAALLNSDLGLEGKHVAVVLSGGNLDMTLLSRVIDRGLVQTGRLTQLRLHLPDAPGALAELTQIVGRLRANIIEIEHTRAFRELTLNETEVELSLETRGHEHVEEILGALREAGFRILTGK